MTRRCGTCTLCCRLLPQRELDKSAGERCRHQRHTGCKIYQSRPPSCRLWSCRWLTEDDTARLRRPDFSHYVIDIMPDFVTAKQEDGQVFEVPAIQVWVDPKHRDAHLDLDLRNFLARRGEKDGAVAIIRYDSSDGFVLIPPSMTSDGNWLERRDGIHEREHTAAEKHRVVGDMMARAIGL